LFSSNAIAIGEATKGSAASAFVAGTDAMTGRAFDSGFDSADQPVHARKKQAATARTAEQNRSPSPPRLRRLLMDQTSSNSSGRERENALNWPGLVIKLAHDET
jgi:hypothetical protein